MRQGRTPAEAGLGRWAGGLGLPQQVFYVLAETPCPYLPGRRERKLITEIDGADPEGRYARLSRAGFRRSHNFAYRPACSGCNACVAVRVVTRAFRMSRSQRRVWRANADLLAAELPARATREQYDLFARYIDFRHADGEMVGMTFADYRAMVEHSRLRTRLVEFRGPDGHLSAACLVDWLEDGASAVYSFFEPALSRRSLGSYMILWLVEEARARGLPYVYLGYWIEAAPKMAYKTWFRPLERFGADGWRPLETC